MGKQQEVIKAFMASLCDTSLNGEDAVNEAVRACSSFSSMKDVIKNMVYDRSYYGANTFLRERCGIILGNTDTGAITGSDAGGSTTPKTENSIVSSSGKNTNLTQDSFNVNGVNFRLEGTTFYSLSPSQKEIWQYLYNWAKGALDLIADSYGREFNLSGKTIYVKFGSVIKGGNAQVSYVDNNSWLMTLGDNVYASLIAHEFTHLVMDAAGSAWYLPLFITEGLAELTRGNDIRGNTNKRPNISNFASGNFDLAYYLDLDNEKMLDNDNTLRYRVYDAGYIFLRYLAQQGATNHQISTLFTSGDDIKPSKVSNEVLRALGGNDKIVNEAANVTMYGGTGNDTLESWNVSNVKMYGESGEDYLQNSAGSYVTMESGSDNDSVYNDGTNASINTGDGNDSVRNVKADNSKIELGYGNDSVTNAISTNVTIDGSYGDDVIHNVEGSNYTSIDVGYGNDMIHNENSEQVTLNGNNGDDSIKNYNSSNVTMSGGDGNDIIENWNYGTNVKMYGDDGNDQFINQGGMYATMIGGFGDDSIYNDGSNVSINAGYGDDSVWNWQNSGTRIELGYGKDSLTNWKGNNATIDGGAGNDFIHNNDNSYTSINAGEDDDTIRNESSQHVTINGGRGDDLISIDGSSAYTFIQYAQGDGNDTIHGARSGDTLKITNGSYSSIKTDSDLIVYVGDNTLLFKGNTSIVIDGNYNFGGRYISGSDSYAKLYGSSSDDTIHNWGNNVTIDCGGGNDAIFNYDSSASSSISGGNGADTIDNNSEYSTLNGDIGNDSIKNYANHNKIDGGDGNDVIRNQGNYTTIQGNSDNDLIINGDFFEKGGVTIKVYGGDGSDSITNSGSYSLLDGGNGSDVIHNGYYYYEPWNTYYENSYYNQYDDANGTSNVTINGSTGNDEIYNNGKKTTYLYNSGDGNDTIYGTNANDTVQITGATYTTTKSGNDVKIIVGSGSILLKDALNIAFTIDGTLDNSNTTSNTLISGSNYNDSIHNDYANYVTIYAYDGADTISGNYYNSKIYGGAGNDCINVIDSDVYKWGSYSGGYSLMLSKYTNMRSDWGDNFTNTIDGGEGDDTINIVGFSQSSINGGNGNDKISLAGDYAFLPSRTVKGGAGNDIIYGVGDQKETLDALKYTGFIGTYYQYSYGDGNDTIYNFHSNDTLSIAGNSSYTTLTSGDNVIVSIIGSGTITLCNDKYNSTKNGKVSIVGGKYEDTLDLSIGGGIGGEYGSGVETWRINGTTATYGTSSNTLITIYGLNYNAPVSGISLNGNVVTLSNSVLNQGTVTISNGYTLKLANDVPKTSTTSAAWSVNGTTATYKANATSAGYYLSSDGKTINYSNASGGNTLVTVSGLKNNASLSGISLNGSVVTLSNSVLNQGTVNVSSGYTLKLANDVPKTSTTSAAWSVNGTTATYKANATSAGYYLSSDGKTINYNSASGGNTLITVSGLKNNAPVSGISLNGNIVTLSNSVLNQGKVTVSNGYTLKLANDVPKTSTTSAAWSVNGTTATYKANATSAGYYLSSDGKTINYSSASGGNTLVTISGLKNGVSAKNGVIDGISIKNNVVSVSANLIDPNKVKISGSGYKLEILSDVPDGISIKNKVLTAASTFTGNKIDLADYKDATKVNAAALSKGVSIVGSAANNSLKGGKGADTISGGAGNDTVSLSGGNDIYIYSGGNDLIQDYTAGQDKIKLSSGSITSASLSSSNVILNISNGGKITVKGGKDKKITVIDGNNKETTQIYPSETLSVGITVKNSIVTAASTFTGNKIDLSDYKGATKVNAAALSKGVSIVGSAANNSLKGGKGADTISGGAGNDTVSLGGGNDIYIYSGGNDLIQDYTAGQDKIKLSSGSITSASLSSSNVILNMSNGGKITVKNGKNKNITVIDGNNKETTQIYPSEMLLVGITVKNSIVTAASTFTGNKIDLSDYKGATKVNAAALSKGVSVVGSAANNSLKGGKGEDYISSNAGNDTLFGGGGNDQLYGGADNDLIKGEAGNDSLYGGKGNDTLTGGAGNDVFIYEGGNDVITDYTAGQDKIKLSNGKISKTTYSGKDVIFTIGSGTLTVKKAKGQKITVTDSSNKSQTYSKTLDLIYDNNFVADEFALDDISEVNETNYSVGKLEYSSNNNELANNSIVSAAYFDEK